MALDLTGAPKVVGEIVDFSSISSGTLKGIAVLFGLTERGIIGAIPKLVRSPQDFERHFGGEVSYSNFPTIVLQAMKRGAAFYIGRVGHYTDATDASTLTAVKATDNIVVAETDITAVGGGEGYDDITYDIVTAVSGIANKLDIKITIPGTSIVREAFDVSDTPLAPEIATVNDKLEYVELIIATPGTDTIIVTSGTITGGSYDEDLVVDLDYIGDAGAETGIHAAGSLNDAVRIAVPDIAEPDVDVALAAFVDARKDMRALVRTPAGLDSSTVIDYREGTGVYTHDAIDSFYVDMWTGGLQIVDSNAQKVFISELADVLASYYLKDNFASPNFSPSIKEFGEIKTAIGVSIDFGTPGRKSDFDDIYNRGVNAVIMKDGFPRLFGNKTLQANATLLQHLNNAEFLVSLWRSILPLIDAEHFQPNDPIMWLSLYNRIIPVLEQAVADRAIRSDFAYNGDQFVDDYRDVVYNTIEKINEGKYCFQILYKPITAAVYIAFNIGVVNSQVDLEVVEL